MATKEEVDEAREALRTALTEALTQPIDISPEGVEKSGGNVQMQPVALNWRELVAWWESGAEQWDGLRDIVQKMIQAAQPVREPLTDDHIDLIYNRYGGDMINCTRAIERAHGIGGDK